MEISRRGFIVGAASAAVAATMPACALSEAPAQGFFSTDLTNLVCWYRADRGVIYDAGGFISVLIDQSGNGRDLIGVATVTSTPPEQIDGR